MSTLRQCPECQTKVKVKEELLGQKVRCPNCKAVFATESREPPIYAELVEPDEGISEAPVRRPPRPAPRRDDRDRDIDESGDLKRPIPSSVVLAIAAMSVLLLLECGLFVMVFLAGNLSEFQVVGRVGQIVFSGVLGGLILWGLVVGHRLAWQWGRILGMLGAILFALVCVAAVTNTGDQGSSAYITAAIFFVISACLFTIAFSLGTATAKQHFGLRCPSCGRFTSTAGDFVFNTARCRHCSKVW
jgi:predicted Zn finger-like uncharacterized protein